MKKGIAIASLLASTLLFGAAAPPDPTPAAHAGFPQIADWNTLKIELTRNGCFGSCPQYRVTVQGDGTVTFEGQRYTLVAGRHVTHILPLEVRALFAAFQKTEFFGLRDAYISGIVDGPSYGLSLSFDGHTKSVQDNGGLLIHMPAAVHGLEETIDAVAGTRKWVTGNEQTVPELAYAGWDFRRPTPANLALLVDGAATGSLDMIKMLLRAGVPLKGKAAPYACRAAQNAAARGEIEMLELLLKAGAPVFSNAPARDDWSVRPVCDVLLAAAGNGAPDVVRLVLARHPKVNRISPDGESVLIVLGQRTVPRQVSSPRDLAASAALLLKAGALVNFRDRLIGENALMLANSDVALTLVLLKAGADPWAQTADGQTAADLAHAARQADVEAVLRDWMAKHPRKH